MNKHETAVLIQRGVTMDTIKTLAGAGYDSVADIAGASRIQLVAAGLDYEAARTVTRLFDRMADVGETLSEAVADAS